MYYPSDMSSIMRMPSAQDAFEGAKRQFQAQYKLVKILFAYVTTYEENTQSIQRVKA